MENNLSFEQLPAAVNRLAKKLETIERLLLKKSDQQLGEQPDKLLTVKEAAAFLSLTIPTIYSKSSRGELPSCKAPGSKRLYFSREDLSNIIREGRRKTNSEIEAEAHTFLKKRGQP